MISIAETIEMACKELFNADVEIELTRPDEQFGDFATNVALQLAGKVDQKPRDIAEKLASELRNKLADTVSEISIAGPGFLNLHLKDETLWQLARAATPKMLAGQVIVTEYSDPNPFKILHAGHVYTTVVGDAIAKLLEAAGAEVHRVNYGGDVGLHVAKTMFVILQRLGGEKPDKLAEVPDDKRAEWLADAYVEGTAIYDDDEHAKTEVVSLNKRIYQIHADHDHESPLALVYWTCREWSYQAFDAFYEQLGTKLEKYYPESEIAESGLQIVKQHIGDVFEESDGAVVFRGEKYGLHTRVFINAQGIPTYEAKDVGLIMKKREDYHHDRSIIITANEQEQYFTVVLKAIEQFEPVLARSTTHLPHGMLRMKGGVKMSSRKGNIVRATDVLEAAAEANRRLTGNQDQQVVLAAVKYALLKPRLGGNLIYDPEESVAIEGNSGPYIQYAHARARSVLKKAQAPEKSEQISLLEAGERSLLSKISEYPDVVARATADLMPHHICTYLYELSQKFNSFYEHNRVIGDPREAVRLSLVERYADTLKDGLGLLNISAPDHM